MYGLIASVNTTLAGTEKLQVIPSFPAVRLRFRPSAVVSPTKKIESFKKIGTGQFSFGTGGGTG
jgi:hypothetical protein